MGTPGLPNKPESLAKPAADTSRAAWFSTNGGWWLLNRTRAGWMGAAMLALAPASSAGAQAWIGEFAGRLAAQQAEQARRMQCMADSELAAQWMFQTSSGKDLREFLLTAASMAGLPERDAKGRPVIRAC